MLGVIMLSVIMLSVLMPSVIMLSVIMLSVMAPPLKPKFYREFLAKINSLSISKMSLAVLLTILCLVFLK